MNAPPVVLSRRRRGRHAAPGQHRGRRALTLAVLLGLTSVALPVAAASAVLAPLTTPAGAIFLLLDEDAIDNGPPPNSFTASDVNDDRPKLAQRTPLRYFANNPGAVITLYSGQTQDEGFFSPEVIPASWAATGPTTDGLRNFLGQPSQPYPHSVGPGLGTGNDPEIYLDKIPSVNALDDAELTALVGRTVCAVVYDSDISHDAAKNEASLKGENLGTVGFTVLSVAPRTDSNKSNSSLLALTIQIGDAAALCGGSAPPQRLSITVDKTNNADGVGGFTKSEIAPTAGQSVPFQVKIRNTSPVAVKIDAITDEYGTTAPFGVCADLIGDTLAPNAEVTCLFPITGYSPPRGTSLTNTVKVDVSEATLSTNKTSGSSQSTVSTPAPPRLSVTVDKTNNADGTGGFRKSETAPAAGQAVDFEAVITNTSAVPVLVDSITDSYPGQVAFPVCSGITTLTAGQSVTCSFTVNAYSPAAGTSRTNRVDVQVSEPGHSGNTATAFSESVVNTPAPVPGPNDISLLVEKTNNANGAGGFSKSETAPGPMQDVPFKVVVINPSATATVVIGSVTDAFGGQSLTVCGTALTGKELAPGGSATCTFTLSGYSPPAGSSLTNTVTVLAAEQGNSRNTTQGQSSSTVDSPPPPRLTVVVDKTNDADRNATFGKTETAPAAQQDVTFQAVITNTSAVPVKIDSIRDVYGTVPSFSVCTGLTGTTIGAGASVVCTFSVEDYSPAPGTALTDTVTVVVSQPTDRTNTAQGSSTSTVETRPLAPVITVGVDKKNDANGDLTYNKTETAPGANQAVTFQAVITNTSGVPIRIDGITDAYGTTPAFAVCTNLTGTVLTVGGTATCTFTVQSYSPPAGSSLTDTVTVRVSEAGNPGNGGSGTSTSTVAVTGGGSPPPPPPPPPGTPDLRVVKAGPATGVLGGTGSYTITVQNTGTAGTPGTVVVTDALPAGVTFVSADGGADFTGCAGSGQSVTCTSRAPLAAQSAVTAPITVVVRFDRTGSLTDTASVPTAGDPTPENNSSSVTTLVGAPDLGIVKTASLPSVNRGDALTYTLAVRNGGTAATTGPVTVTDTVPAGLTLTGVSGASWTCPVTGNAFTCTYTGGALAPGASAPVITVTTTVTQAAAGQLVNTGIVSTPNDPNPANDTSTVITPVLAPDLAIDKKTEATLLVQGGTVTYTLSVTNIGTGPTTGPITVTDALPAGLNLTSVQAGPLWSCTTSATSLTCTWTGPALTGGNTVGSAAQTITVLAAVAANAPSSLTNTGVVTTPGDGNPANDTDSVSTPVGTGIRDVVEEPATGPEPLGPPVTPVTPAAPEPPAPVRGVTEDQAQAPDALAFTGSETGMLLSLGLAGLLGGALLLLLGRRRTA